MINKKQLDSCGLLIACYGGKKGGERARRSIAIVRNCIGKLKGSKNKKLVTFSKQAFEKMC